MLNEVMGSNSSAFSDENGAFPDYVELLNTGSAPADLNGLVLTDKPVSYTHLDVYKRQACRWLT